MTKEGFVFFDFAHTKAPRLHQMGCLITVPLFKLSNYDLNVTSCFNNKHATCFNNKFNLEKSVSIT
uniref:Uncharacterized protein n=1 Tax=Anguilla anguilla TaxID=7936 RepID=A0A0E9WX63_ANGAN